MTTPLRIHTIVSMPFAENTYLLWLDGRDDVVIVDPGLEPELILQFLADNQLRPAALLNTHGHADHIGGNAALKGRFPDVPLVIGVDEEYLLGDPFANLSAPFGYDVVSPPADRLVREGDILEIAGLTFDVLDVPGHSPGHVAYVLRGAPRRAFSGDVLFERGVGRSDFPGSDPRRLRDSIRLKMYALPDDTIVHPGHGGPTTIGAEKRGNPFVR